MSAAEWLLARLPLSSNRFILLTARILRDKNQRQTNDQPKPEPPPCHSRRSFGSWVATKGKHFDHHFRILTITPTFAYQTSEGTYFSVLVTDDMEAKFQSASDESASSQERHGRDNTDPNISYRAEDRRS